MIPVKPPEFVVWAGRLFVIESARRMPANNGHVSRDLIEPPHKLRSGRDRRSVGRHHTPIPKIVCWLESGGYRQDLRLGTNSPWVAIHAGGWYFATSSQECTHRRMPSARKRSTARRFKSQLPQVPSSTLFSTLHSQ